MKSFYIFVIFLCFAWVSSFSCSGDAYNYKCSDSELLKLDEKINSGNDSFLDERIICLRERKNYEGMESDLNRLLAKNGGGADAYLMLAEVYASTGRCSLVLSSVDKAVSERPNDMSMYVDGANLLERCGERELAIILLKSGISRVEAELRQESGGKVVFFPALEDARDLLEKLEKN